MAGDIVNDIHSVLTPQEIEATVLAENAYAGQAKKAAAEFADAMQLGEEGKTRLLGAVSLHLSALNFEERRDVAHRFTELTAALGGKAVDGAVATDTKADLMLVNGVHVDADASVEEPKVDERLPASEPEPQAIADVIVDDTPKDVAASLPPAHANAEDGVNEEKPMPLSSQQRRWFAQLLPEQGVTAIENLSLIQREELIKMITTRYVNLSITRLNLEAKEKRAAQLTAFMEGKSNKEIAAEHGCSPDAVWAGLDKMADSIGKRISQDELADMIMLASDVEELRFPPVSEPTAVEDAQEEVVNSDDHETTRSDEPKSENIRQFNPSQRAWLGNILSEEAIDQLEALPLHLRLVFATNLGEHYKQLKIPRATAEGKVQRAEQLTAFIEGKSYEEIAAMTSHSKDAIRVGLYKLSHTINRLVSKATVASFIPNDSASELVTSPKQEIENPEIVNEPQTLSKFQTSWYRRLLGESYDTESLAELNEVQQDYLSELLARKLRAYYIRKDGPVKTARRVETTALIIKGRSLEEIADAVSLPLDTLKKEIDSSVARLHNKTPSSELAKIIEDTRNYTAEHTDGSER